MNRYRYMSNQEIVWQALSSSEQQLIRDAININATDSLIEKISGLTKQQHYNRNEAQKHYQPLNYDHFKSRYADEAAFKANWLREGESPTHNLNVASGNISYRGIGESVQGFQFVFDVDGEFVNDAENRGTKFISINKQALTR